LLLDGFCRQIFAKKSGLAISGIQHQLDASPCNGDTRYPGRQRIAVSLTADIQNARLNATWQTTYVFFFSDCGHNNAVGLSGQ
jgi:hypothetical protein